ncbi:MAG TPA: hypothetical protein VNZ22_00050 [Bacillota bacterium]|nr:hypothetical protein [Bacillota bacterium]
MRLQQVVQCEFFPCHHLLPQIMHYSFAKSPGHQHFSGVKSARTKAKAKSKKAAKKVIMPILVTEAFRDTLQRKVKAEEHGSVSKIVRQLLRERYRGLPAE